MRELSLNVLDIAQNSVAAGAKLIEISLKESTADHELFIDIRDNGKGMSKEKLERVLDPFFTTRTTRKVGMGVPLFKLAAEMTGGKFEIDSVENVGTNVKAYFKTNHLDFTPIGDMTSTFISLVTMNLNIDFVYERSLDGKSFTVDTRQLKEILGDVPLNEPEITQWITDYVNENTKQLTEV